MICGENFHVRHLGFKGSLGRIFSKLQIKAFFGPANGVKFGGAAATQKTRKLCFPVFLCLVWLS
jgi:hypothetical protein